MPDKTACLTLHAGYLAACEQAAPSPKEGMTAFLTWCLAKVCGWDESRRKLSRSTWYRHVAICRQAGLPVPEHSPCLHGFESGSGWFGTASWKELTACITREPARLYQLAGKPFEIVQGWDAFYPEGTTGVVLWLQYGNRGWQVEVMLDGSPGGNESLSLPRFLRRTQPVEAYEHG